MRQLDVARLCTNDRQRRPQPLASDPRVLAGAPAAGFPVGSGGAGGSEGTVRPEPGRASPTLESPMPGIGLPVCAAGEPLAGQRETPLGSCKSCSIERGSVTTIFLKDTSTNPPGAKWGRTVRRLLDRSATGGLPAAGRQAMPRTRKPITWRFSGACSATPLPDLARSR